MHRDNTRLPNLQNLLSMVRHVLDKLKVRHVQSNHLTQYSLPNLYIPLAPSLTTSHILNNQTQRKWIQKNLKKSPTQKKWIQHEYKDKVQPHVEKKDQIYYLEKRPNLWWNWLETGSIQTYHNPIFLYCNSKQKKRIELEK